MGNTFPSSFTARRTLPQLAYPLATLALLLAAAGTAPAQTPVTFASVSNYATGGGNNLRSVAVADINGDSRPDIVTANYYTSSVGVLLGQAGGFATASTYSAGANSQPASVAIADVSGDGQPDIVTANRSTNTVGVLLGQTGGVFATPSTYSTGTSSDPRAVAVADVNGDGRPDIITANYNTSTAGVLLGRPGGGFASISTYSTGSSSGPQSVTIADVNRDGRLDIITANFNTFTAGVLLGQTSGGFGAPDTYPTGGGTSCVAVSDVNGDGRPDIVTANGSNSTVGVLLGQTSGGFAVVSTYSAGISSFPQSVAVADMNGDGQPDIVTANYNNSTAGVLLGQTGGGFAVSSTYSTGTSSLPQSVAVADVNGDGRPDIITANSGSNTAGVLLNTGTFTPLAATAGLATADVALFPNPARGGFAVQLPAAWGTAPVRVELLNALGQVVAVPAAGFPLNFATASLAPGVYVLRVQAGGHTVAKRVVLE